MHHDYNLGVKISGIQVRFAVRVHVRKVNKPNLKITLSGHDTLPPLKIPGNDFIIGYL